MVRARRRRSRHAWMAPALVGIALLGGLLVLSTAGGGASTQGFSGRPCDPQVNNLPAGVSPPARTVILLDRSRSARGTPGRGAVANDYAGTVEATVREAVEAGDTVSIAGFDGSAATIRWSGSVTVFRGDPTRRLFHVREHQACLERALRTAAASAPQAEGSDVLGALRSAALLLGPRPAAGSRVLVVTDGLANVGCASVDAAATADPGQVKQILDDCRAAAAIPELHGVDVRLLGLGQPGPGEPIPDTRDVFWLRGLWRALCTEAGAEHCDTDGQARGGEAPPPALPASAPRDPVPRFPRVTVASLGSTVVIELPDALLFGFDSARLLGDAPLDWVVGELRRLHVTRLKVEGHTDSRGDAAYNLDLSKRRAEAVADALRARGISVAEVVGYGETRLKEPNEYRPDGTPDLRAMAINRRVQIVVSVLGKPGG